MQSMSIFVKNNDAGIWQHLRYEFETRHSLTTICVSQVARSTELQLILAITNTKGMLFKSATLCFSKVLVLTRLTNLRRHAKRSHAGNFMPFHIEDNLEQLPSAQIFQLMISIPLSHQNKPGSCRWYAPHVACAWAYDTPLGPFVARENQQSGTSRSPETVGPNWKDWHCGVTYHWRENLMSHIIATA